MIAFEAFTKRFGERCAVDSLSLRIGPGEAVALLGPNGSGKTTSLKAAAGLTTPTSGRVTLGEPARQASDPRARRLVSYLPQRVTFAESLTGREVLEFYRLLRGEPCGRTAEVLRVAALNGSGDQPVSTYSGGMIQRLGLAVATLPDAAMLLLDEPTAALDPEGLGAFYDLIESRRRAGRTVLFTSHQLGDVERLADRFAVLVRGRLIASLGQGELTDWLADHGTMRVHLGSHPPDLLSSLGPRAPGARWDRGDLIVPAAAALRPIVLDAIRHAGVEIMALTVEEGRLETLYHELVGKSNESHACRDVRLGRAHRCRHLERVRR